MVFTLQLLPPPSDPLPVISHPFSLPVLLYSPILSSPPYITPLLPTSPLSSLHHPSPPYITPLLPTSPLSSLHHPSPPYITPLLPTSPLSSLHHPSPPYIMHPSPPYITPLLPTSCTPLLPTSPLSSLHHPSPPYITPPLPSFTPLLPTSPLPSPPSPLSSLLPPSPPLLHLRLLPPVLSHVQVIVVWGGKESMPQRLKLPPLPVPLLSVHQPHLKVGANSWTVTCVAGTSSLEQTLGRFPYLNSCMLCRRKC